METCLLQDGVWLAQTDFEQAEALYIVHKEGTLAAAPEGCTNRNKMVLASGEELQEASGNVSNGPSSRTGQTPVSLLTQGVWLKQVEFQQSEGAFHRHQADVAVVSRSSNINSKSRGNVEMAPASLLTQGVWLKQMEFQQAEAAFHQSKADGGSNGKKSKSSQDSQGGKPNNISWQSKLQSQLSDLRTYTAWMRKKSRNDASSQPQQANAQSTRDVMMRLSSAVRKCLSSFGDSLGQQDSLNLAVGPMVSTVDQALDLVSACLERRDCKSYKSLEVFCQAMYDRLRLFNSELRSWTEAGVSTPGSAPLSALDIIASRLEALAATQPRGKRQMGEVSLNGMLRGLMNILTSEQHANKAVMGKVSPAKTEKPRKVDRVHISLGSEESIGSMSISASCSESIVTDTSEKGEVIARQENSNHAIETGTPNTPKTPAGSKTSNSASAKGKNNAKSTTLSDLMGGTSNLQNSQGGRDAKLEAKSKKKKKKAAVSGGLGGQTSDMPGVAFGELSLPQLDFQILSTSKALASVREQLNSIFQDIARMEVSTQTLLQRQALMSDCQTLDRLAVEGMTKVNSQRQRVQQVVNNRMPFPQSHINVNPCMSQTAVTGNPFAKQSFLPQRSHSSVTFTSSAKAKSVKPQAKYALPNNAKKHGADSAASESKTQTSGMTKTYLKKMAAQKKKVEAAKAHTKKSFPCSTSKVKSVASFSPQAEDDMRKPGISAIVVFDSGDLVLVDITNSRLKYYAQHVDTQNLLSRSFRLQSCLPLSKPYYMCQMDSDGLLVSQDENCLSVVRVTNFRHLKLAFTIATDCQYYGVSRLEDGVVAAAAYSLNQVHKLKVSYDSLLQTSVLLEDCVNPELIQFFPPTQSILFLQRQPGESTHLSCRKSDGAAVFDLDLGGSEYDTWNLAIVSEKIVCASKQQGVLRLVSRTGKHLANLTCPEGSLTNPFAMTFNPYGNLYLANDGMWDNDNQYHITTEINVFGFAN